MPKHSSAAPRSGLEQSKELLVLAYFLFTGNRFASADRIVEYWLPGGTGAKDKVLPRGVGPEERSLSRAGAAKICKRLVDEGLLVKKERRGYRNKMIHEYQLPTSLDFLIVAERLKKTYPVLMLRSEYGKNWLRGHAIPNLCGVLRINLKPCQEDVEWVVERSPTAFAIITDDTLRHGAIAGLETEEERTSTLLETLICAMKVDMASGAKGLLLDGDGAQGVTGRLRVVINRLTRG